MTEIELGPVRFAVEHRQVGSDGGPTLRVYDAASGRELLRFDCFAANAHWHVDPSGRNAIRSMPGESDPIDWTLGELSRDLGGHVQRAGLDTALPPDPERRSAALKSVERALRSPED